MPFCSPFTYSPEMHLGCTIAFRALLQLQTPGLCAHCGMLVHDAYKAYIHHRGQHPGISHVDSFFPSQGRVWTTPALVTHCCREDDTGRTLILDSFPFTYSALCTHFPVKRRKMIFHLCSLPSLLRHSLTLVTPLYLDIWSCLDALSFSELVFVS